MAMVRPELEATADEIGLRSDVFHLAL